MVDNIYFGLLQLRIFSEEVIPWKEEEKNFFHADLIPRNEVDVRLVFVEQIASPQKEMRLTRHEPLLDIYTMKDKEYRYYYSGMSREQAPFACSESQNESTDYVKIFIRKTDGKCVFPKESLFYFMHIENLLLDAGGILLHSCYMEYKERAILLTAPSGTGKTTHSLLWKRLFHVKTINGDRGLIQKSGQDFYACGFFFHGSAAECENKHLPLDTIVVIRRSDHDYIEELSPARKLMLLFSGCTINHSNPARVEAASQLLSELIERVRVVMLHCTMKDSAAFLLKEYIDSNGTI